MSHDNMPFLPGQLDLLEQLDDQQNPMTADMFKDMVANLGFGKVTPTAVYIHWHSAWHENRIPKKLQRFILNMAGLFHNGSMMVIKLYRREFKLSIIECENFDRNHPVVREATCINCETMSSMARFYQHEDAPIYHRREEFFHPDDLRHTRYKELTDAEEKYDLYANTSTIGTRAKWNSLVLANVPSEEQERFLVL